jgi:hypothetical protein
MVRAEMKAPIGSGKGGAADPSLPRFKCQECHRALVSGGIESFGDRLPANAASGTLAFHRHTIIDLTPFGFTNP